MHQVLAITGESNFVEEQEQLVDSAGRSRVDIVVATPGRLVDHIVGTHGFSLENLEFLVKRDLLISHS